MFEKIKNDYDKKYNEGLKKAGVFFAFGKEQFDKNKTHKNASDYEYSDVGIGGYIHESNEERLVYFLKVIAPKLKADFISKINIEDLIEYELNNHECFYTGDYSEVIDIVKSYYDMPKNKIEEKVKEVYKYNLDKNKSDFDIKI